MKQSQLEELIRHITQRVLKEYSSMFPSDKDADKQQGMDTNTPPEDAMSLADKNRLEREKRLKAKAERDVAIATAKSNKATMDGYRKQVKNYDTFGKKNDQKDINDAGQAIRDAAKKI